MRVTEEEAKEKWCPMVRLSPLGHNETYKNAITTRGFKQGYCIGSECMMWGWLEEDLNLGRPRDGHCALAGVGGTSL